MQPIDFADILSTELQLAHTGYLTHALCLQGTATLLFNGAKFPLQAGDCLIIRRSELAQIASLDKGRSAFFSHQDPAIVEWFGQMVEERKKQGHHPASEKKAW